MAQAELFTDAALADGRSPRLVTPVSVLVRDGILVAIYDGEVPDRVLRDTVVTDASGATIVPAFVDCHSHLTLPGGARWMEHGTDPTPDLLAAAEENAAALMRSGVRWVRDVGSVRRADAPGGKERALALPLRDQWNRRRDYPYVRAAGTWLSRVGTLPDARLSVEAADADQLLAAASQQLDEGADLVKLYLDGPDADVAPWTVNEVRRVVEAVHARGATVAAHATRLANCRLAADAAVDTLEHGFVIDADTAAILAVNGTTLVATLTALTSRIEFSATTAISRFTDPASARASRELLEQARHSIKTAHAAGVSIAAGSDSGGGSVRAGHLAWEITELVAAGLQPWEALAAATWRGGDVLGIPDAGRISLGTPARFILIHGDPLTDPAATWRIWRTIGLRPSSRSSGRTSLPMSSMAANGLADMTWIESMSAPTSVTRGR